MIKIKSTMRKTADEIAKTGSVIKINGVDFNFLDAEKLETEAVRDENRPEALVYIEDDPESPTKEEVRIRAAEIEDYNRHHSVYVDASGQTVLFLCYDPPASGDNPQAKGRAFMFQDTRRKIGKTQFVGSNHLRWFDKDLNHLYDDSELDSLIQWWNAGDEADMRAMLAPTFQMFHMDHTGWKYSGDENHPEQLAGDFADWKAKELPTKQVQASEAWFMKGVIPE